MRQDITDTLTTPPKIERIGECNCGGTIERITIIKRGKPHDIEACDKCFNVKHI